MIKLLHTSDWHLGKRLEGKPRLSEQRDVLEELVAAADREEADVVVAAGDIYDTFNPSAEAEELFYTYAVRLAAGRRFVAIAGNHDNAERLCAPGELAKACNIVLVGGMDDGRYTRGTCEGLEGGLRLKIRGETLNLALLPYPSYSRMSALGYKPDGETYADDVRRWLNTCAACFTPDGYNVLVSHLFMLGSEKSDEAELGSAALLPLSVLPEGAHYTALGHIHKPQKVSGKRGVYYSGSILKYSFDDLSDKFFNLVTLDGGAATVTQIPVTAGKNPAAVRVTGYDEAIAALEARPDEWVQILYDCVQPLSGAKVARLKEYENFCNVKNVYAAPGRRSAGVKRVRSDRELFCDFFARRTGEQPTDELIDLFLRAAGGEQL